MIGQINKITFICSLKAELTFKTGSKR